MPSTGTQYKIVTLTIILTSVDPLYSIKSVRYSGISEHLVYHGSRKFPRPEMLAGAPLPFLYEKNPYRHIWTTALLLLVFIRPFIPPLPMMGISSCECGKLGCWLNLSINKNGSRSILGTSEPYFGFIYSTSFVECLSTQCCRIADSIMPALVEPTSQLGSRQ